MRERTNEFRDICEGLLSRNAVDVVKRSRNANRSILKNQQSVNKLASQLGHEIYDTAQKLAELSRLAKSQSPFGDPTQRIEELTFIVKNDIAMFQERIQVIEKMAIAQSSSSKVAGDHSKNLIQSLNTSLLSTTKQFAEALQTRTENLKTQQQRRDKFSGSRRTGPAPQYHPNIQLLDENDFDGAADGEDDISIAVPLLQTHDSLIFDRVDQVRDIEGHISEIQGIFQKLSNLVAFQGEQIQRIEDNIDEVDVHANEAHRQLSKYLVGISSDRWLIFKVFMVLVAFIFLFVMFFI
eukprot:TRINITY_DN7311_c0_g1_i1.p1 TRINITY_DN7311_c0_g1~~TRINITY_DN7311_c0_g1_i1.p1  ORF type:complete len:295 (+),score=44.14 TRINITY_DN7311_c0_g1_i1:86-970(+)